MTFRAAISHEPSHSRAPGTWKPMETGAELSASFACPQCGVVGSLEDHEIKPDGSVLPSVVCPEDCGFHDYVVLEGWHGRNGMDRNIA